MSLDKKKADVALLCVPNLQTSGAVERQRNDSDKQMMLAVVLS